MSETTQPVLYRQEAGIAEIRFNRPERLNALDPAVAAGFGAAVDRALGDDGARVILVSAEGRAFVAGGDLGYFHQSADRPAAAARLIGPIHDALKKLAASPKITLGSLKGAVAGGGMSIALSLDLAVAADNATFNLAYGRIGASPDCGGSWALPRLVGTRKALEIALLSGTIDAAEALRLGLVNRVVPLADLENESRCLAARLAMGAPIAQARIKALLRTSLNRTFEEQLDLEAENFAACSQTADFGEAIAAFVEKRKPEFRGR